MPPARRASDRATAPASPEGVGTKRALLAVSRSLESLAARTTAVGSELAVVALFEDAQYFGYERERYAQLAATATVVVGFVGEPGPLPPGVGHFALPGDHTLARTRRDRVRFRPFHGDQRHLGPQRG